MTRYKGIVSDSVVKIERQLLPDVSYGECLTKHTPYIVVGELANGYCVECWDKTNKGGCMTQNEMNKALRDTRRNSKKKEKA